MTEQNIYTNADRILASIYLFENPIAILDKYSEFASRNYDKGMIRLDIFNQLSFNLNSGENSKENNTQINSIVGRILRTYRDNYPNDYSADQVELQIKLFADVISRQSYAKYLDESNSIYLFKIISEKLFTIKSGKLKIKYDSLFDWNGYINKLDLNIFIGAYLSTKSSTFPAEKISDYYPEIDHSRLERQLLEKKFAENHSHLQASGYITQLNWYAFLSVGIQDQSLTKFVKNNYFDRLNDYYSNEILINFLRSIKYLRLILDLIINDYMYFEGLTDLKFDLNKMKSKNTYQNTDIKELLFKEALNVRQNDSTFVELYRKYENFFHYQDSKKLNLNDILSSERKFWFYAFKILTTDCKENTIFFRTVLNLYLLSANVFKMNFVQKNKGNGFDNFSDAEKTKSVFLSSRSDLAKFNYSSIFKKYLNEPRAKKIELRITPHETVEGYYDLIRKLDRAYSTIISKKIDDGCKNKKGKCKDAKNNNKKGRKDKKDDAFYGLIVHFIKEKPSSKDKTRYECYRKIQKDLDRKSAPLKALMTKPEHNKFSKKIVGIDTANLEFMNPPEIFGNLYRSFKGIKANKNFHFTYHVGESFFSLTDGMRHIFEVIWRLEFDDGDRLGHALALGIDPETFLNTQRRKEVTDQQSNLDNLAWFYFMISEYGNQANRNYLPIIEAKFNRDKIWLENDYVSLLQNCTDSHQAFINIDINTYIDFYLIRGCDMDYIVRKLYHSDTASIFKSINILNDIDLTSSPKFNSKITVDNERILKAIKNYQAVRLFVAYMIDEKIYSDGKKSSVTDVDENMTDVLVAVQNILQRFILKKGISIEANPSSNLKIGYDKFYSDLPFLKLNRHGLKENNTLDIPISINTDDGAIFQTSLPYEYELITKSLIEAGESPETVYDYILHLQESSIRTNFVN